MYEWINLKETHSKLIKLLKTARHIPNGTSRRFAKYRFQTSTENDFNQVFMQWPVLILVSIGKSPTLKYGTYREHWSDDCYHLNKDLQLCNLRVDNPRFIRIHLFSGTAYNEFSHLELRHGNVSVQISSPHSGSAQIG